MTKKGLQGKRRLMSIGELKRKSKADMKNHYGFALLATILLNLVAFGSFTVGLFFGWLFTAGAVQCCKKAFYTDIALRRFNGVDSVYGGIRRFLCALVANIFIFLIYLGLGIVSLLLFAINSQAVNIICILLMSVAALVLYVKLSLVFFVMNHDTDASAAQCIKHSWKLTNGHFWKIIGLELSFIGWNILVFLTLGALTIYVAPYKATTEANLYLELAGLLDGSEQAYASEQSEETAAAV